MVANLIGNLGVIDGVRRIFAHWAGRILPDEVEHLERDFCPKTIWTARVWLAICAATITAALIFLSWRPVLLIGLPRSYGV